METAIAGAIIRPHRMVWFVVGLVIFSCAARATSELPELGESAGFNIVREAAIGRSVFDKLLKTGLIETQPMVDRYINDLGFRLLAGLPNRVREYQFFIVRDDAVNAFALPGGYIGINRGLIRLTRSQHQLASVIAHEISHVRSRHGLDLMEKSRKTSNAAILTMLAGLLLGQVDSQVGAAMVYGGNAGGQQAIINFTRENEYEADRLGMALMQSAGFDPHGMVEFFYRLQKLSDNSEFGQIEYLRTHPLDSNRIAEAASRIKSKQAKPDQVDHFFLFKDYLRYLSTDHLPVEGSDYLRALAHIQAGEHDVAGQLLDKLYRQDRENIWYGVAYGENLEHLQRDDEAELVYRRLLDIFPENYALSLDLLRMMKLSGQNQAALAIARSLENRFPSRQKVYFELSDLYRILHKPALMKMAEAEFLRLQGNPEQAVKLYDEIMKMDNIDLATVSEAREKRLLLLKKE